MPRSNRPRGQRPGRGDDEDGIDLNRALRGRREETYKRDGAWTAQSIAASSSTKHYTCPACGRDIAPGIAHVVAWRADGIMGEADDIAARRHWHTHCWRIKP
jgi:hypothetical protein